MGWVAASCAHHVPESVIPGCCSRSTVSPSLLASWLPGPVLPPLAAAILLLDL